ncbi:MAG: RNB domain-containing ribonuclease [Desulfovibrio sp.]|jgi:exoribonuclease-2|nr:RNB domain-containing ribonuclease [Desulfovibrio sp.]
MIADKVEYPGPGCLVEFMQGNSPVQALVIEEQNGRLRLYAVNRRENSLPLARLLPWSGPSVGVGLSRLRMDEILETHQKRRAALAAELSPLDLWKLAQGELETASAEWLAGLVWDQPDIDREAALGHALLATKTHFRFSPPNFEIFSEAVVESRLREAQAARERELFVRTASRFFQRLWDAHCRKLPPPLPSEVPEAPIAEQCRALIFSRLRDPDTTDDASLWNPLIKGLPESPHLPLYLAIAWGLAPEHYNFWLDRIGFESGVAWADIWWEDRVLVREKYAALMDELQGPRNIAPFGHACGKGQEPPDPENTPYADTAGRLFVSIDPADAQDRDDAFYVEKIPDGAFIAHIALACPAAAWIFGNGLDKAVLRRGASLYLPEGDEHMLPADVGYSLFSLDADRLRPCLMLSVYLTADGDAKDVSPRLELVRVCDNLDPESCEAILHQGEPPAQCLAPDTAQAEKHGVMLRAAFELALLLQERRVAAGAVITERPTPNISLRREDGDVQVHMAESPPANRMHVLVGELMVLANSMLATWARDRDIPLLYRTQDVALPREFAGVWTEAQDIARVVRSLPPSSLKSSPRRHSGLALAAYATLSSPLRRYVDLLNQGQVIAFLRNNAPRLDMAALDKLLPAVSARLNAAVQVQRSRPRYWKLLYFRQQGDKKWWDAIIVEENEGFVTVALPWAQLTIRSKRRQFDEKIHVGMRVQVRVGKIQPLLNEIQVLEVREE